MRCTARFLAELLPETPSVDDYSKLQERTQATGATIFDCYSFMREVESGLSGLTLPESWEVTSDSIAARLAIVLAAEELVLLKSASPPSGFSEESSWRGKILEPDDRNQASIVDNFFHRIAGDVPTVRIVNLRDPLSLGS